MYNILNNCKADIIMDSLQLLVKLRISVREHSYRTLVVYGIIIILLLYYYCLRQKLFKKQENPVCPG